MLEERVAEWICSTCTHGGQRKGLSKRAPGTHTEERMVTGQKLVYSVI